MVLCSEMMKLIVSLEGYIHTDGSLLRHGCGRHGRDREGGRRKYRINIDPSWDAPFGI
jgi:hypothetical protein